VAFFKLSHTLDAMVKLYIMLDAILHISPTLFDILKLIPMLRLS